MTAIIRNTLRVRAIYVSRAFREVFRQGIVVGRARALAVRLIAMLLWGWRWRENLARALFATDAGLRVAGEHVLADLRGYCFAEASTFDPDPYIAARRAGRRDVWLRITRYLHLDEGQVQSLMEIDDGQ